MRNEKQFVIFVIAAILWLFASQYIARMMGWTPPPPKRPAPMAADHHKGKGEAPKPNLAEADVETGGWRRWPQ